MNTRQVREDLERITNHTQYIKNLYEFFKIKNLTEPKTDIVLELEYVRVHGKVIEAATLTISNYHGLLFKVSSDPDYYSVFRKYIVGNYSIFLDKWKYSPIHINLYEDFDKVYDLFITLDDKKYINKLLSTKEYINTLYSDLIKVYNI